MLISIEDNFPRFYFYILQISVYTFDKLNFSSRIYHFIFEAIVKYQ